MVETAEELELETLKKYRKVGITAGASTPNWVINQVIRTLEDLPSPYESSIWRLGRKFLRFLFESNLALALGVSLLSLGLLLAAGYPLELPLILIASLFLFAAHTVNRLVDLKSLRLNDPSRADFLEKNRRLFLVATVLSYILALLLAAKYGPAALAFLVFLALGSVFYSLPIFGRRGELSPVQRIPGGRSLFIAFGWWAVIVFFPALVFGYRPILNWLGGVIWTVAFMRAVFLELLELQGDGFVGKETLPVFIGREKTFLILKALWFMAGLLILGGLLDQAFPPTLASLFLALAYAYFVLHQYEKELLGRNFWLELLAEGLPVVTGLCLSLASGVKGLVRR